MFKRILIAVGASIHSETVINVLELVAKPADSQIEVMSVANPLTDEQRVALNREGVNAEQAELAMATQIAEHAAEIARANGYKTTVAVCFGNVSEAIITQALTWGADLIAMSTHARDGLGRIVRGSIADEVVHGTSLPVMLCNPNVQAQAEIDMVPNKLFRTGS